MYLRKPYFLNSEEKSTNVGTLYHKIFELLPIKKYSISSLNEDSDYLYKEKEISFYADASYYDNKLSGSKILLDGVIDLLFIKDDCYYIVDYKTDKVDNLEVLKDRYSIQLELYEIGVKEYYHAKKVKKFIYSIALNKYTEV